MWEAGRMARGKRCLTRERFSLALSFHLLRWRLCHVEKLVAAVRFLSLTWHTQRHTQRHTHTHTDTGAPPGAELVQCEIKWVIKILCEARRDRIPFIVPVEHMNEYSPWLLCWLSLQCNTEAVSLHLSLICFAFTVMIRYGKYKISVTDGAYFQICTLYILLSVN